MEKILTQEQLKKLFALCKKYEVYDYDVQIEVVDHIASSIEEQWKHDDDLGFGWALKKAFKNMGWRTFRKLESKLSRQMKWKFNRLLWNYFLDYFKLPKTLITLSLSLFFFIPSQLLNNNNWVYFSCAVIFALISIWFIVYYFPKKVEIKTDDGKSFMLLNYLKEISTRIGVFIQLPLLLSMNLNTSNYSNQLEIELIVSILLSLIAVLFYGYFFVMPQKIRDYFFTHYPEYAQ